MPRQVDHEERRAQIVDAAVAELAESGLTGLTMRSVAKRLGGTVTMVTHYFPTRQSLLEGIQPGLMAKWRDALNSIEAVRNQADALRAVLAWMLPLDEETITEERAWLSMLSATDRDSESVDRLHDVMDAWMRELIRTHLSGMVEPKRLEVYVDVLRTATRGICTCACENPDAWPVERQLAALDEVLAALGLKTAAHQPSAAE